MHIKKTILVNNIPALDSPLIEVVLTSPPVTNGLLRLCFAIDGGEEGGPVLAPCSIFVPSDTDVSGLHMV